jgi:hypothetical protein
MLISSLNHFTLGGSEPRRLPFATELRVAMPGATLFDPCGKRIPAAVFPVSFLEDHVLVVDKKAYRVRWTEEASKDLQTGTTDIPT